MQIIHVHALVKTHAGTWPQMHSIKVRQVIIAITK